MDLYSSLTKYFVVSKKITHMISPPLRHKQGFVVRELSFVPATEEIAYLCRFENSCSAYQVVISAVNLLSYDAAIMMFSWTGQLFYTVEGIPPDWMDVMLYLSDCAFSQQGQCCSPLWRSGCRMVCCLWWTPLVNPPSSRATASRWTRITRYMLNLLQILRHH